jgi:hypothetical protein
MGCNRNRPTPKLPDEINIVTNAVRREVTNGVVVNESTGLLRGGDALFRLAGALVDRAARVA